MAKPPLLQQINYRQQIEMIKKHIKMTSFSRRQDAWIAGLEEQTLLFGRWKLWKSNHIIASGRGVLGSIGPERNICVVADYPVDEDMVKKAVISQWRVFAETT